MTSSFHTLSPKDKFMVLGEYLGATIILISICTLFALQKIPRRVFLLFLVGLSLASVWEFAHELLGKTILRKGPALSTIPGPVYALLHSVYDAMLFLLGTALCYGASYYFLRDDQKVRAHLGTCSPLLLLLLFSYGVGQELLVEHLCNNNWWTYTISTWNPVLISPNITTVPVVEWAVAIVIYACFQILIFRKM